MVNFRKNTELFLRLPVPSNPHSFFTTDFCPGRGGGGGGGGGGGRGMKNTVLGFLVPAAANILSTYNGTNTSGIY